MSGIKSFVGRKMTKSVPFMDEQVDIYKLNVSDVEEIQELLKESSESDDLAVLRKVITAAVEGGEEMTPDDFRQLPIEELSKLSEAIMKFSGLDTKKAEGK